MDFKNKDNHFAFKLFIIILLLGTSQLVLIVNYLNLPILTLEERNNLYSVNSDINIKKNDKDFWVIALSDHKITGFENIIIYIFMLWGFMKCIDLMFFLEKYKKD